MLRLQRVTDTDSLIHDFAIALLDRAARRFFVGSAAAANRALADHGADFKRLAVIWADFG
jgi:hypothetical protein